MAEMGKTLKTMLSDFRRVFAAATLGFVITFATSDAWAAAEDLLPEGAGIEFTADEMNYDQELGIVTASGSVEVFHEERILRADTISYNQRADVLNASGNISLVEPTGDVTFAEYLELSGDMKDGIIQKIRLIMSDKSRFAANKATHSGGNTTVLDRAVYSPCNLCSDDPSKPPLWQIKAVKITHDKKRRRVEYSDAWLEVDGIPIAYTPYLSHPDPTVKRQTGFLTPSLGGSSDLGFIAKAPFFYNISPNQDATITPIYTREEGASIAGEYRHALAYGEFKGNTSLTADDGDEFQAFVDSEGRFDLNDTWRWGFDGKRATNDTYMRRYKFGFHESLDSRIFLEGFRDRTYLSVDSYAFQGMRATDEDRTTPLVVPMVDYSHTGKPDRFGGRTSLDVGLLALSRRKGTDTRRLSAKAGWQIPYYDGLGDIFTLSASLEGAAYHVNGLSRNIEKGTYTGVSGRITPEIRLDWQHPFIRKEKSTVYQMIEPMASVVVTPHGGNEDKQPNEDSIDFVFDDTNLFSSNRFSGIDRIEGGPRFNYGIKWGVFGAGGGSTTLFIGQSYRAKTDHFLPEGSGLEGNFSDYVANAHISPGEFIDLFYRTRRDQTNFSAKRDELRLLAGPPLLRLGTGYVFFDQQSESEFSGREEVSFSASSQVSHNWRSQFNIVHDLTSDGGTRSFGLDMTYENECIIFTTDLSRNFYQDRELKPSDSISVRITFKTLGQVASGISRSQ
jgi:LPS-assembly protein